jgi:regulatory protein
MDTNKAKSRLAKLCSTKEVCEHDALEKLLKWEITYPNAMSIIDWLIDEKFINNNRYAHCFVKDKYRFNKWGRIKIRYALRLKKVSSADIDDAMIEINEKEYHEILLQVVKAKILSSKENDAYKLKAKVFANAQSKGYESELIFNAIDEIQRSL